MPLGLPIVRTLLDNLEDGVLISGVDGTLKQWNRIAVELLAIPQDPRAWYSTLDPETALGRALAKPARLARLQVGGREIAMTTRVLADDSGQPIGRLHLVRASQDPDEADEDNPQRVLHEIKNALHIARSGLELLAERSEPTDVNTAAREACERLIELCAALGKQLAQLLAPRSSAASEAAPPAPTPARLARVLVLDDDEGIRNAVIRALADTADVTAFVRSPDALQSIAKGARYDVILCDILMPGKTGVSFFHELALIAPDQAARVVFVTGATTPEALAFLDSVPNLRLEKPLHNATLRDVVARQLADADADTDANEPHDPS